MSRQTVIAGRTYNLLEGLLGRVCARCSFYRPGSGGETQATLCTNPLRDPNLIHSWCPGRKLSTDDDMIAFELATKEVDI